jgi:hypothetical protein
MPRKFEATDEQRNKVRALAGYGLKQQQIAVLVGVRSTATLRKHFRDELVRGPIEAQHNVRRTLFKLATSGRNPGVTMYWLKRWGGWSEKGKPPEPVDSRPTEHTWRVRVYQPPRTPEQEQMLREALSGVSGPHSECDEWEEYTAEDYATDRPPPGG